MEKEEKFHGNGGIFVNDQVYSTESLGGRDVRWTPHFLIILF